jgi:pimeloyl-ACP methyl ester carboxylesterase
VFRFHRTIPRHREARSAAAIQTGLPRFARNDEEKLRVGAMLTRGGGASVVVLDRLPCALTRAYPGSTTMQLEVITRTPKGRARPTPLLFVHGAYGGAWEWDEHFLPYFAERGWVAHALSLRGHAGSDGAEAVRFARLRDYVADVERVAGSLPAQPTWRTR